MASDPTTHTIRCGDIKRSLAIQDALLNHLEATIREVVLDPDSVPLSGWMPYGGFDPINGPGPIIIKDHRCQIPTDSWISADERLHLGQAFGAMRCLLQMPWSIVAALPDDHLFDVPSGIKPLGLAASAEADEAEG